VAHTSETTYTLKRERRSHVSQVDLLFSSDDWLLHVLMLTAEPFVPLHRLTELLVSMSDLPLTN